MPLVVATTGPQLEAARLLFGEYAAALGFSLQFQGFAQELATLPGAYAPPAGRLLLAEVEDAFVGCIGLRPHADGVGELKRLYVRPALRGRGVARALASAAVREARSVGYRCLRLDTLATMTAALTLYRSLGFRPTAPYRANPMADAVYLELVLH